MMTEPTTPAATAPDAFVDINAAADFLGVSKRTIQRCIAGGQKLPHHRVGHQLRFKLSEVERWLSTNKPTATKRPRRKRA